MPRTSHPESIGAAWEAYRRTCVPPGATINQLKHTYCAFLAGVLTALQPLGPLFVLEDPDDSQIEAAFDVLHASFHEALRAAELIAEAGREDAPVIKPDCTTIPEAWESFAGLLDTSLNPVQLAAVRGIFLAGVQAGVVICRTTLRSGLELDFGALSRECLTLALDGEEDSDDC